MGRIQSIQWFVSFEKGTKGLSKGKQVKKVFLNNS
jgi:hypothetical protein